MSIAEHAYRTWMFALALSLLDGAQLNPELLYVGALLHDTGLVRAVSGEDFTLRSAQRAEACLAALGRDDGKVVADAITAHTTPGVTVKRDGELATYIQAGSMVDLTAQRIWDLPRPVVHRAWQVHPRGDIKTDIMRLFRAEARAVPCGRFSLLRCCGFGLAVRVAPV